MTRSRTFISYSHADSDWLERLRVHLKPLERDGMVDMWDDTKIKTGAIWREEIARAIDAAKVAVLLVSADYLASDFIAENELPPILSAAAEEGLIVIPVIVSPSSFLHIDNLGQFQSINWPSRPLSGMNTNEQESLFVKIAEVIRDNVGGRK